MLEHMLHILRCPVTKSPLQLKIISTTKKLYDGEDKTIIQNGILFSENDWFYPVINGIPRLLVEAYEDYESFFEPICKIMTYEREPLEKNTRA
jgi:uncharacterized protein YbaR (Trm112 family)